MKNKRGGSQYIEYSESFKMEVIRQIEEQGLSIGEAQRRYGIKGKSTVQRWLRKYGKANLLSKKIIVMKAEEVSQEKKQAARIKELEAAIVQLQLEKLAAESYLELACEQLGQDPEAFKKKSPQRP